MKKLSLFNSFYLSVNKDLIPGFFLLKAIGGPDNRSGYLCQKQQSDGGYITVVGQKVLARAVGIFILVKITLLVL